MLCDYIRGVEGIIVALAERLGWQSRLDEVELSRE
jgi:hypothetical protein